MIVKKEKGVSITRLISKLMVLLLIAGILSGCAISRMYLITVDEQSEVTISVNGFEVLKEGINEGQTPEVDVTAPLVPGM